MKNRFILILLLVLSYSSCKKFLTEDDRSSLASVDYYKTYTELQNGVNGIYFIALQPFVNNSSLAGIPYTILDEVNGQNVDQTGLPDFQRFYHLNYASTSPMCQDLWTDYYQGIQQANVVLASVSTVPNLTTAQQKLIIGEASFLRAYFYYNLVNIFGPVPLKTKPTLTIQDALIPKTDVKDIYNNVIVPDLLNAVNGGLPASPAGNGFISTGAAQALLAKVYLSMTGQYVNDNTKYAAARDMALNVINSGNFSLWQSDANLSWFEKFNNTTYNNTQEVLWDIDFTIGSQNNFYCMFFLPNSTNGYPPLTGYIYQEGGMSPSPAYLNSYDPHDLRGKHQLGFWFDTLKVASGASYDYPVWYSNKFLDKTCLSPGTSLRTGLDYHAIRYADLLLTYAEAQNQADGSPNATSYAAVNSIRARAGLPAISGLSQADFQTEVWKERYWELDLEGWLWFDIVRTQKMFDGTNFVDAVGFKMPSGVTFTQANFQFPIPQSEININPLLK